MFFRKKTEQIEERPQAVSEEQSPMDKLRVRIGEAQLPQYVADAALREVEKLEKTDPAVAEYSVGHNYIDFILSLPWNVSTQCKLELDRAQSILDARHYGLSQVKQRILEFLAAKTLCGKARQSILVVDDEEIARSNMEHVLKKDGYHCRVAVNGLDAMRVLAEEDIDLVITDLKMDQMDGLELLQQINRVSPEIPVIMITGFATVSSAVEALRKGAAHYLGKPVNLDELRRTVKEVLQKKLFVMMGRGPILCFTGPPGTGKTSVGRAIAEALQRQFVRVSLAGLRDEAELRGHRRTYVGALPGRIISEMKRVGFNNPVFMLDEIDKIGQDFRGDPASVLLEVLDPEQNVHFTDHYLEIPFDLSRVMFIATANDLSRIPGPLLDRMERIEFSGYTDREKQQIAKQFIVPRQLKAAGLPRTTIHFSDDAITRIITDYTRESGLRNLERELADICRKIALLCLESKCPEDSVEIDTETVTRLLGPRKFYRDAAEGGPQTGIATGLVWAETGGEIISVETAMMPGSGQLILTGSLGEVLQESAQAVLSFIRSRTREFGVRDTFFQDSDIHIHFPSGGIPKDGPSAGITIFAALLSLLTGRPARRDVALTGEMTLSGRILPVSGIREKVLAAKRAGAVRVLLPAANREEVEALAADVTEGVEILLISMAGDAIDHVLEGKSYILPL
ncbi:MAG: endopeptidase La [Desulfobulbaceae bacterium]|nr:MAG: endopeptidase La [Desulfobulbaceae bacterium]